MSCPRRHGVSSRSSVQGRACILDLERDPHQVPAIPGVGLVHGSDREVAGSNLYRVWRDRYARLRVRSRGYIVHLLPTTADGVFSRAGRGCCVSASLSTCALPRWIPRTGGSNRPTRKPRRACARVGITLYLRDELLGYTMDRRARGLPIAPSNHFGTSTGRRSETAPGTASSLARSNARGSNRAAAGSAPLPEIMPHSLSAHVATFAPMVSRDPAWIAVQGRDKPRQAACPTRRFLEATSSRSCLSWLASRAEPHGPIGVSAGGR
jgi:hypothetical protein